MRVLITGGAGFIGSHTADALLAEGHDVRVLDSLAEPVHHAGWPAYLSPDLEVVAGDVREKAAWEQALREVDAVVHLAAYQDYLTDFSRFFHVNSVGTALLYEVAVEQRLSLQRVVVASSQAVYGEGRYQCRNPACPGAAAARDYYPDIRTEAQLSAGQWDHRCPDCDAVLHPVPTDERRVNPQNQYAISKYTQELIALNLGRQYHIPTVVARYSIVQGPRQSFHNAYSGACRIFSLSYLLGRAPTIYEDGRQLRDFVNIADVVAANLLLLTHPDAVWGVFNVGGGRAYSMLEFAEIVRRVVGSDLAPVVPGEYRFGDTRHIVSDITRLQALGWSPRHPPEKSVADYVAWVGSQTGFERALDDAEERMRALGVLRRVRGAPR
ncbi:MAG: SDR family NAD(P)-dependent oxidoreductase [Armatimonadota bacterium]|nr:SDR family NAD(P)-dependent oxidoreductase [Armatimonadota bacterium]MDR7533557.1 SDR family NAD(P)-dependent oxidoreductase [Armatimonadota bacterium]MDR7537357.1 SDR family NAD(P)-dependent oxidoreductase [Armatimonadota bacterium]